jgi:hypothetical protein
MNGKYLIGLAAITAAGIFAGCENINQTKNNVQAGTANDITNSRPAINSISCADYANNYSSSARDINERTTFSGLLQISADNNKCLFLTNEIPNHDFNDGSQSFRNKTKAQNSRFIITQSPQKRAQVTSLSLRTDNAIFLNGVKLDLLAAACYGVADERIGCFDMDQPWRFDPLHPENDFGTDSHHAHTQPNGAYHYHGSPKALYQDDSSTSSPVIGFAADGFPIFGPYFQENGRIEKATSSYRLKNGSRQSIKGINPGGTYTGKYLDDYEYVAGQGNLDQCNGRFVNGQYGYYVTDSYPWVLGCFSGNPDSSFNKRR